MRPFSLGFRLNTCLQLKHADTQFLFKRTFKIKKKTVGRESTSIDKALEHFDLYYSPVYQDQWPSIRIALLTTKKSAAVMNNFAAENKYEQEFMDKGGYDIMKTAAIYQRKQYQKSSDISKAMNDKEAHQRILRDTNDDDSEAMHNSFESAKNEKVMGGVGSAAQNVNNEDPITDVSNESSVEQNLLDDRTDLDGTNLHGFIPAKTVYSETETLRLEEARQNFYSPMDIKIDVVRNNLLTLPQQLKIITYPPGDVSDFAQPKIDHPGGLLCFYMMDAASILPVIALDLEEGDDVLDLCAAPGGKSLGILQTRLPGSLTCNDLSGSRVKRLLNVLQYYVPEDQRQHVTVTRQPGTIYNTPLYDKVLVDVPCNTDRHVLVENDNNLFGPKRLKDRLALPPAQVDLLLSGIKSCRPGGSVVYSTCTLSPSQNDGIIQQVFDTVWRETAMDIMVEDLGEISDMFQETFNFYKGCRFGQLVVPSLMSNFGPMYICKIKRRS